MCKNAILSQASWGPIVLGAPGTLTIKAPVPQRTIKQVEEGHKGNGSPPVKGNGPPVRGTEGPLTRIS